MKKTFFIAASLFALTGCNKEIINVPVGEGKGTLNISVESDDCIKLDTKASVSTDDFKVTVFNEDDQVKTGLLSEMSVILLDAGTYYVYAENIAADKALTENSGKGALHIAGKCDPFTLAAGGTETADVTCSPVNSKITVSFDASFTTAFSSYSVKFDQQDGDRDFDNVEAGTDYFYNITSNNIIDVTLSATAAHDPSSEYENVQNITLKSGYHYLLKYSAGSKGQITVNVTATDDMQTTNFPVEINPYNN